MLAVSTTILTLIVSLVAAYAFARFRFRGRHLLLVLIILPQLVPSVSVILPLYRLFEQLGVLNSYWALTLIYTGSVAPLTTWILTGFIQALPYEIEEAAIVDGANVWQRLRFIVVPLTVPALIGAGVLAFREAWNEFPLILALTTDPGNRTLPYQLFLLRDALDSEDLPLQNAFALLTILPLILLYMRFERHVVGGLTRGAVK